MTRSYHDIYRRDIFRLAGTLCVKSAMNALKINEAVKEQWGNDAVDETDLTTWKYYMNICGEYHPTQQPIYIKSLDTMQAIVFDRATLVDHPNTSKLYAYGSRYYNTLVYDNPEYELLIKGVLYPANKTHAINAVDGAILAYEKELVEPQEESFLFELEEWFKVQFTRWHVKAFNFSDEYYVAAHLGIVLMSCLPKIINIRLKYAKTREAHSYHVYHYLASHNRLHEFYSYLSFKQRLFFYRNIRYIQRNLGKESTADWLVDYLFTQRFISASNFILKLKDEMNDAYYTAYDVIKEPMNTQYNVPPKTIFTLPELENKYRYLTSWNKAYIDEHQERTDLIIKNAPYNHLKTKHIEIASLNYDDHWEYKKLNVFMNQWFYMAAKGKYTSYVYFTEPHSNQTLWLSAENAAVYLIYHALKIRGVETSRVIPFFVNRAYHGTPVTLDELKNTAGLVHEHTADFVRDLNTLVINQPVLTTAINSAVFNTVAQAVYDFNILALFLRFNQRDKYRHKDIRQATHRFFTDEMIHFSSEGKLWDDWREENLLVEDDYTDNQRYEIMYELIKNSTPYDIDDVNNTRFVKRAMTRVAERLSSYAVQYLETLLDDELTTCAFGYVRFTEGVKKERASRYLPMVGVDVIEHASVLRINARFGEEGGSKITVHSTLRSKNVFDTTLTYNKNTVSRCRMNYKITHQRGHTQYSFKDPTLSMSHFVPGYENVASLTDAERISLVDIYTSRV